MYATWVQNHPPNKSYSNSWNLPDFLGLFLDFLGRNKKFVGQNLKNVHWNRTNNVLFHQNYTLFLLKKAQITRKRAQYLKRGLKISIFKPSENRIIPSNFFWTRIWMLNGEIEVVKISQIDYWILNSFYLIVEQMLCYEFEGVAC